MILKDNSSIQRKRIAMKRLLKLRPLREITLLKSFSLRMKSANLKLLMTISTTSLRTNLLITKI